MSEFKNSFGDTIFQHKYANYEGQTWKEKCELIADNVTENIFTDDNRLDLTKYMQEFKFMPGGRYIYYAGRQAKFYNNCYLLKGEEDTREEWGRLLTRASDCLMSSDLKALHWEELEALPQGHYLSCAQLTKSDVMLCREEVDAQPYTPR